MRPEDQGKLKKAKGSAPGPRQGAYPLDPARSSLVIDGSIWQSQGPRTAQQRVSSRHGLKFKHSEDSGLPCTLCGRGVAPRKENEIMPTRASHMPHLLSGPIMEAELKKLLLKSSRAKIAVAYWGSGAVDRLNIEVMQSRGVNLQIVCDLMSGGCNPDEVEKLIQLLGKERVRAKDNLHAKVWITDVGCIIGSSNASANGLGHEGDETRGLIEANVLFLDPDPSMLGSWESWFDRTVHDESRAITEEMLAIARKRWLPRRALRDGPAASSEKKGSLLNALINQPELFRDKPLCVNIMEYVERSEEAELGLKKAQKEFGDDDGKILEAYESWRIPAGTYILDFSVNTKRRLPIRCALEST